MKYSKQHCIRDALSPVEGRQGLEKWPWPPDGSMPEAGFCVSFSTFHQRGQGMGYQPLWAELKLWSMCLPGVHKSLGFSPSPLKDRRPHRVPQGPGGPVWPPPRHFSTLAFVLDPSGSFLQKGVMAVKNTLSLSSDSGVHASLLVVDSRCRTPGKHEQKVGQTARACGSSS